MNISQVLQGAEDVPEESMAFAPSRDADTVQQWNTMENTRYRRDDIREDIYLRGGSEELPLPSSINGNITTLKGVETSFGGIVPEYLLIHTDTDYLYLYNKGTDSLTDFGTGHGFASSPLQVFINGRFLYLFDRENRLAKYIRLNDLSLHTWMGHERPFILDTTEITDGDITRQNIWGFKEGGEAFVYVLEQASFDTFFSVDNTGIIPTGVYKYVYNSGRHITYQGRDLTFNEFLIVDTKQQVSIGGSGTDPELISIIDVPFQNADIDYSPLPTKINQIREWQPGDTTLWLKNPWYPGKTFFPIDYGNGQEYLVLPFNSDIQQLEESGGKYEFTGDDITELSGWTAPTLTRAYTVVYELDDGSYSLPSAPVYHNVDSSTLFDANGILQIYGVEISTSTSVPGNVIKIHLFGTRWQYDLNRALAPSDKYPNSAFFLIDTIQAGEGVFVDKTPDEKLLQPLSGFIPMANGLAAYFGGGQIKPHHASAFKEGVLIGGYDINRPTAEVFQETVLNGSRDIKVIEDGSQVADTTLFFVYEYTDNTLSRRFDTYTNQTSIPYTDAGEVYVSPPSALVQAVHVYSYNSTADEYRLVKRLTSADPEFFGVPFTLAADPTTEYETVSEPDTDPNNETVHLDNYYLYGTPFQLLQIESQKPIADGARIAGIQILRVDTDRADAVRYQVVIFTELHPYLGYFDVRAVEGGLLFQADFEKRSLPTGLMSADSLFLNDYALFYQGRKGIYVLDSGSVQLAIPEERYPELADAILDTAYQPVENELWFLLPDNRCLVIDFDRDGGPPVYEMHFPKDGARTVRQLAQLDEGFYCSADGKVLLTDDRGRVTDAGFLTSGEAADIAGCLKSDYLSPADTQLYLKLMELFGTGYSASVRVDLQSSRFDDGAAWTDLFTDDIDTGPYPLSMKGLMLELASRGVSPRLAIDLSTNVPGRLAGAKLYYTPVEHEGAARF